MFLFKNVQNCFESFGIRNKGLFSRFDYITYACTQEARYFEADRIKQLLACRMDKNTWLEQLYSELEDPSSNLALSLSRVISVFRP